VAVARNTVLAEARHDTVLFTDDDCAVPPEWCRQLGSALRETAAVAAPVRVPVTGPVSAYGDYHRMFDAVPAGRGLPVALVTTNCGLRRDLVPASVRFDPRRSTAGEDTAFAIALGQAGVPIRWLADATPISHGFSEEIEELTGRFMRNARGGLELYLTHGHAEAALPGALTAYRQRLRDDLPLDRRFSELVAAEARTAFATYHSMSFAATLVGYLDRLGAELGQPLVELDLGGLVAAFRAVAAHVRERTAELSTSDWANLEVDYRGMKDRLGEPEPLLAEVREALRRYARPVPDDPTGPVRDILDHGAAEVAAEYLDCLERVRRAFDDLCAAPDPVTRDALDRAARAVGVPFKTATDTLELRLLVDVHQRLARRRPARATP
jgi:hypothetical protein